MVDGIEADHARVATAFAEAKGHAESFAGDVFGWYGRYKLIHGQHEEFLAETFRERVP